MLLQSHSGVVRVFPAVPAAWTDASFVSLRTYGAFLVSAKRKKGSVVEVRVTSEKGGLLKLENPFRGGAYKASGLAAGAIRDVGQVIEADMRPGDKLLLNGK
jgi:alpha-L-fucosidase 2